MERPCLKVFKGKAEETRKLLLDSGLLDPGFMLKVDGRFVLIPVREGTDDSELSGLGIRTKVTSSEMVQINKVPRSYKDLAKVPDDLRVLLPTSFDVIGEVLILKLPDELLAYKEEIGRAVLDANRHVRSVTLDRGVKGELRVRDLETIAGSVQLETVHVENNLRFKLDPSLVYFSPRLSTERMRLASLVRPDESVLDMFCGVGPFALTVARYSEAKSVLGIDLNPDCIRFLKVNATLNSLSDRVEGLLGDSREIVPTLDGFDRVIMNLPHSSLEYLELALNVTRDGGWVHLYIMVEGSAYKEGLAMIMYVLNGSGRKWKIETTKEVHQYSPTQHMMVFDINVLGPA